MKKKVALFAIVPILLGFLGTAVAWEMGWVLSALNREFQEFGVEARYRGRNFTGLAFERYPNGNIQRIQTYWKGKKSGRELIWHGNGNLWIIRSFWMGQEDGEHRAWYADGKPQFYKKFIRGEPHGEFWNWYPTGRVAQYVLFDHGKEVSFKSWAGDGKIFYNYVYQNGKKVGVQAGDFCSPVQLPLGRSPS